MARDPKLDGLATMMAVSLQQEVILVLVRPAESANGAQRFDVAVGASTGDAPVWAMATRGVIANTTELWSAHACRCPQCATERAQLVAMDEALQQRSQMARAKMEGVH